MITSRYGQMCLGVAVVGAVAMLTGSVSQPSTPMSLDVMTFNIRTSNGRDGDDAWPYRKQLVADTIGQFAPDVAGLQEALDEQIEYLDSVLPDYRWLGIDRGLNGGEGLSEYTPIFYRHAELTPIESGNFWLSETPDAPPAVTIWRGRRRRPGRIVTWARFHHRTSGRQIYVYNTHLTIRQGETQLNSVRLIASRVAALPAGTPVVVTGDFNAPAEDSDTWRTATAHELADAWILATERRGPAFTLSSFGPPRDWGVGRIDWILVGGPVDVQFVETVVYNDEGRYPSDHYPVVARLHIP